MERDPVCGMDVERDRAAAKSVYEGDSYYFCSSQCQREFDKSPDRYTKLPTSMR